MPGSCRAAQTMPASALSAGADVNARNSYGETALMKACQEGYGKCAHLLLAAGADVSVQDKEGYTPLIYAVFRNFGELARQFIEAGADVNAETQEGITALSMACRYGHADCARLLIESGANVNAMVHGGRFHGMTALKAARENNCTPHPRGMHPTPPSRRRGGVRGLYHFGMSMVL